MRRSFPILILAATWALVAQGAPRPFSLNSQVRLPGESAREAARRYFSRLPPPVRGRLTDGHSALQMAVPVAELPYDRVSRWGSPQALLRGFARMRDSRFIADPDHPGFPRRSSWLYPDDGCYARAALAVRNLKSWNYLAPTKAFVFGDLRVTTPNSPAGSVSWWYHVVPVVRVGEKTAVLDPAIEPKRPLTLQEWVFKMVPNAADVKIAFCSPRTYSPSDDCLAPEPGTEDGALEDQLPFLGFEWERLIELNRAPERELGEFPPWLRTGFSPGL